MKHLIGILVFLFAVSSAYSQVPQKQTRKAKREVNRTKRTFKKLKKLNQNSSDSDTIIWEQHDNEGNTRTVKFLDSGEIDAIVWDSITDTYYQRIKKTEIAPDHVVLGYHPYWMKNSFESYQYDLLTHLSYYSASINPVTGALDREPQPLEDWNSSPLIDSVKRNGVKLLLSVVNYGEENIELFLRNDMSIATMMYELKNLLEVREADGIELDFEEIPKESSQDFTHFVKRLKSSLGDRLLFLKISRQDQSVLDIMELNPYVDYYVLQSYAMEGVKCNGVPAPVAPLFANDPSCPSISNSVNYYLNSGLPASKMILGLPLFGTQWRLEENNRDSKNAVFDSNKTLGQINAEFGGSVVKFDSLSGSTYILNEGQGKFNLIWYENEQSLNLKMNWASEQGLAGTAVWALGYDGGESVIWKVISNNYTMDSLQVIEPLEIEQVGNVENGVKFTVGLIILFVMVIGIIFWIRSRKNK